MNSFEYREIKNLEPETLRQIENLCIASVGVNDYVLRFLPQWILLPNFLVFGAFLKNSLVGVGFLMLQERYAWLMGLRVQKEWHNKKISHRLEEIRIQAAFAKGLSAKAAVLESNEKVIHVMKNLGFLFAGGFSVVSADFNTLKFISFITGNSLVEEVRKSDINKIYAYLHSHYSLDLDGHSMYGENFVWRSVNSYTDLTSLIASKRILVSRRNGDIQGVAIINESTADKGRKKIIEIGRMWGESQALLWKITNTYKPAAIRWYVYNAEEESLSSEYGFRIMQTKVSNKSHDQRYVMATITLPQTP